MSGLAHELVGEFINAVVQNPTTADVMLTERPELLNARWIHEETVLHFLAIEGFTEGVRFLAVRGADVNAVNEFGDTALVDVAVLGATEIADILLSHGANPDAQSDVREHPLHAAARRSRRIGEAPSEGWSQRWGQHGSRKWYFFDAVNENPSEERQELLAVLREYEVRDPDAE